MESDPIDFGASGKTATPENAAFAKQMKQYFNDFEIKGLTVKVGVPKPGATGVAEVKVIPWGK